MELMDSGLEESSFAFSFAYVVSTRKPEKRNLEVANSSETHARRKEKVPPYSHQYPKVTTLNKIAVSFQGGLEVARL